MSGQIGFGSRVPRRLPLAGLSLARLALASLAVSWFPAAVHAAEEPLPERAAAAVRRGLELVQAAADRYPEHRQCFSCHHQALPLVAMRTARDAGFEIRRETWDRQIAFTRASFEQRRERLLAGERIEGRVVTVAYGLLTWEMTGQPRDAWAEALAAWLLQTQHADGHWERQMSRPPLEDSHLMAAGLAASLLPRFAAEADAERTQAAVARAKAWIVAAPSVTQEDRVARLWAAHRLKLEGVDLAAARRGLWERQREDGGWGQLDDAASDAYATGQTLFVLLQTAGDDLPCGERPAARRAVEYLCRTQVADGSWRVETRVQPVQTFFDNGDPHGKHQFISIAGSSWAVASLAAWRQRAGTNPGTPAP